MLRGYRTSNIVKPTVYIETSIPSYLTARSSRDLIVAANQQLTKEWWDTRKDDFQLVISELVSQEASAGDPRAAKRRLSVIQLLPEINITDEVGDLAMVLVNKTPLPHRAHVDALEAV